MDTATGVGLSVHSLEEELEDPAADAVGIVVVVAVLGAVMYELMVQLFKAGKIVFQGFKQGFDGDFAAVENLMAYRRQGIG